MVKGTVTSGMVTSVVTGREAVGGGGSVTVGTVAQGGWNLLRGDLPLPALVLKESALAHNIALMASWCLEHAVLHAPHGKTTIAPQLFKRQLEAGAWAITAATASHARIYRAFGVQRILLANELVEPVALRWLADQNAAFVMLDRDGSVLTTTGPVRPSDARLRRAQAMAPLSGAALQITRELIYQKLAGQERVARLRQCRVIDSSKQIIGRHF